MSHVGRQKDVKPALTSSTTAGASTVEVPRYIPLPDCLYKLRRRFPGVTQCVMLECLRCRQWTPVEVLDAVPPEVEMVSVHVLRTRGPANEGKQAGRMGVGSHNPHGFYPLSTTATPHTDKERDATGDREAPALVFENDPMLRVQKFLSDNEIVRARMFEEARRQYVMPTTTYPGDEDAHAHRHGPLASTSVEWHSPRLRQQQQLQQVHEEHHVQQVTSDDDGATSSGSFLLVSMAEQHFGAKLLHSGTGSLADVGDPTSASASRGPHTTAPGSFSSGSSGVSAAGGLAVATAGARRKNAAVPATPLYIPNPAIFVCPWQNCQSADLLLDVRADALGEVYDACVRAKLLPNTADPHGPRKVKSERKQAEKEPPRNDRLVAACEMSSELWRQRHALNEALAHELGVRRSGRLARQRKTPNTAEKEDEDAASHHQQQGSARAQRALQVRFLKEAAEKILHGAPEFVSDMDHPHHSAAKANVDDGGSYANYERVMRSGERALLSAFCWVVCDHCGKLRRLAQPFPGGRGAPFVCALSGCIGSCEVSEADGVTVATAREFASQEELAIVYLASSMLPEATERRCAAVLHGGCGGESDGSTAEAFDDPLLRAVHSDAARRAFRYSSPALSTGQCSGDERHSTKSNDKRKGPSDDMSPTINADAFPVLKQLTALLKKRGAGAMARRLCITPQEVRRKREEVLRAYLHDEAGAVPEAITTEREEADDKAAFPSATDASEGAGPQKPGRRRTQKHDDATDGGATGHLVRRRGRKTAANPEAEPRGKRVRFRKDHFSVSDDTDDDKTHRVRGRGAQRKSDRGRAVDSESGSDEEKEEIELSSSQEDESVASSGTDAASDDDSEREKSSKRGRRRTRAAPRATASTPSAKAPTAENKNGTTRSRRLPAKRTRQESTTNEAPKVARTRRSRRTPSSPQGTTPSGASPPVRRGPGRPPGSGKTAASQHKQSVQEDAIDVDEASDGGDKVFWVQCDRCDKWRILPRKIRGPIKFWECKMRSGTTCADPEDEDTLS